MKLRIARVALLCLAISGMANAAPITIENFSFELPGSGKLNNWTDVPGWHSDTLASDSGVESDWPGSTEGAWAGYIMGADPAVWQLTGHAIAAGEVFTLKIDLQNNYTDGTPSMQLRLYYDEGGVRVPAATALVTPASPWSEFSLAFTANDAPGSIGRHIGVELDNVTSTGSWIGMDNVRLDVVPEPATLGLLAAGLLVARRRRA